jgi:gas vesicle protein GvpA/GvpJ/GvpM family
MMSEPLELIERSDASLLDTVDHLLNKGLVLTGEVVIGLAGIDLIYLRLTALLCAADRILPKVSEEEPEE